MVAAVKVPCADTVERRCREAEGVREALEVTVGAENWGEGLVDRVAVAPPLPVTDPEFAADTLGLGLGERVPVAVAQGVGVSVTPEAVGKEDALCVRVKPLPVALAVPLPPPTNPAPPPLPLALWVGENTGESLGVGVGEVVELPVARPLPVASPVPLTECVVDRVPVGDTLEVSVAVVQCVRDRVSDTLSDTV